MKCTVCQTELIESAMGWYCPTVPLHPQICKGCLVPMTGFASSIGECFCENPDCKRTPEENMRDLFRIADNILPRHETQKSVSAWTRNCFPEWSGPKGRGLAVVEEAVELARAIGLTEEEIQSAVDLVNKKEAERHKDPNYVPEPPSGEIADTLLNVLACAEELGCDAQNELNKKMFKNRKKSPAEYQAKTRKKRELGLKLNVDPRERF